MVCLSYSETTKLLDFITEDYDVNVFYWSDNLLPYLEVGPAYPVHVDRSINL